MSIDAVQDSVGAHPGRHRNDCYHRPGDRLRPAPSRMTPDPAWDTTVFDAFAPRKPDARQRQLLDLFIDHYWQGDELMDAVVLWMKDVGVSAGRRLLDAALDNGIDSLDDPPTPLVNLFSSLDNPPEWFDRDEWERGRQLWIDCSTAGKIGMVIEDFIGTFVGAEVSTATGVTGRFVNDFYVRNVETSKWFFDATKPEFIDRFSPEFKDTVRVRLMHAQVRLGLRRSLGDDHFETHGNPISTSTTMGAAVTFGLLPMLIDHNHGRSKTIRDMDLVMRYWSYIAYLFGAAPAIIPTTAADGILLADHMSRHAGGPTEWTAQMACAAESNLREISGIGGLVARAAVRPFAGAIAYYTTDGLARYLFAATDYRDIGLQPWKLLTQAAVHANVKLRMILDRVPGAEQRLVNRARHGDPYQLRGVKSAKILARRKGVAGTPYTHHDQTPSTPAGCPIR